jgi:hypothetical protein
MWVEFRWREVTADTVKLVAANVFASKNNTRTSKLSMKDIRDHMTKYFKIVPRLNLGCLHPVARVISYDIGFIISSTQL